MCQQQLLLVRIDNIGDNTIIGGGSFLTSNVIDDDCTVGENCILMEGARLERGATVGSNSVVHPGTVIPAGQFWAGNPATFQGDAKERQSGTRAQLEYIIDLM